MVNLLAHLGMGRNLAGELDREFPNLNRIQEANLPTLIIHGERDTLIPRSEGESLYGASPTVDKSLVIIHGADHNDIMIRDTGTYFGALKDFVSRHL